MRIISLAVILLLLCCLSACVTAPPSNVNHICRIFKQYPQWYKDAKRAEKRWKIPISVQMAIIHQESRFNGVAQPERTKLLWIIPWKRPSTAFGYTQALSGTWQHYQRERGGMWSSRDNFGDGVDFIGWYANKAHARAGIPRDDAYALYLAYHEGVGGYMRKTYLKKKWLIQVAQKVKRRAHVYQHQLLTCEQQLNRKHWYQYINLIG